MILLSLCLLVIQCGCHLSQLKATYLLTYLVITVWLYGVSVITASLPVYRASTLTLQLAQWWAYQQWLVSGVHLLLQLVHTANMGKTELRSCLVRVSSVNIIGLVSFVADIRLTFSNYWYCNSFFTPPTRTRQNCLVLSVSAVWIQLATKQDSFVLSRPNFQFAAVQSQIFWGLLKTWQLETGSRQDKTVLFCPCRRCEQAISAVCNLDLDRVDWCCHLEATGSVVIDIHVVNNDVYVLTAAALGNLVSDVAGVGYVHVLLLSCRRCLSCCKLTLP